MKTTKIIITALLSFFINAASAEEFSLGTGYASDYFEQGLRKAEESIQATLGVKGDVAGMGYSIAAFTNQSINSGVDTYIFSGGLSRDFSEGLISTYVGLTHVEDVSGEASQELDVRIGAGVVLSPTISLLRDLDSALFAYELSASHSVDLKVANLNLSGSAGNVETSKSSDTDYYTAGGELSRAISKSSSISASLLRVDSDSSKEEYVTGLSISTQF